ncbi:hypothetical protein [uncultured Fibrobacter sp.]|jgi:hypothetical protein|uniref:hypothetical protein n=1 Tax=uncultured Fibrobacter sp. TaxID=261512 RepID=UPI0025F7A56B|nr:hypothetical protein [uncultured Fibrobacter sp.]
MFSFLNGKSPFDVAEEKLEAGETVNGKPKLPPAPVMGWQDGVFLVVLIALIFGGYQYYKHTKQSSAELFARCDALYVAAEADITGLPAAEACYDSTWDLGFVSDSMEVLRQNRLGEISDKRNAMKDLLEDAKDAIALGDTAKAVGILGENKGFVLLRQDEQDEWKAIAGLKN